MEDFKDMFACVGTFLNTVEEVQPPPLHSKLAEAWWIGLQKEWLQICNEAETAEEDKSKGADVIECFQIGFESITAALSKQESQTDHHIQGLLNKPQSVQRTEEWYREMKDVLSASEFYKLFSTQRARGELVMSKVFNEEDETASSPRTCCLTMEMTPLDWGIRFEPVAKMILEHRWKANIAEMGRVHHPSIKGLAASPDGLITHSENSELIGDLVEIKCPSTREVGKGVPIHYWYQMQLQMEVTSSPLCQFSEFTFRSYTAQKQVCEIPEKTIAKGNIFVIQNIYEPQMKYLYSPLDSMDWIPPLDEGWEIIEKVPWFLEKLWIEPVIRDKAWFSSIEPLIHFFWEDVHKARKGEFNMPESSVKKRQAACAIID